jgi:hypothetical protein
MALLGRGIGIYPFCPGAGAKIHNNQDSRFKVQMMSGFVNAPWDHSVSASGAIHKRWVDLGTY